MQQGLMTVAMLQPIDFYHGSVSPYAWKVWLALEHKKVPYRLQTLSLDDAGLHSADYARINPRQRIPAIVDGDVTLYESAAILEYLEDKFVFQGAPLWPRDVESKAHARRVAAEIENYLAPAVLAVVTTFTPGAVRPDEAEMATRKDAMAREWRLIGDGFAGDFISGDEVSAADFTLYPYAAYMARVDALVRGQTLMTLAPSFLPDWMQRMQALPYFADTLPLSWR